jgi:hypothetical protein
MRSGVLRWGPCAVVSLCVTEVSSILDLYRKIDNLTRSWKLEHWLACVSHNSHARWCAH